MVNYTSSFTCEVLHEALVSIGETFKLHKQLMPKSRQLFSESSIIRVWQGHKYASVGIEITTDDRWKPVAIEKNRYGKFQLLGKKLEEKSLIWEKERKIFT